VDKALKPDAAARPLHLLDPQRRERKAQLQRQRLRELLERVAASAAEQAGPVVREDLAVLSLHRAC
jgi:hypothetical protein